MRLLVATVVAMIFCNIASANNYTVAKKYVYARFSQSHRQLMLKILGCETGQKYNAEAHNSSGAAGYFQIMPIHDGTRYTYNGISIVVDFNRIYDPGYNTLVAYLMSHDGKDLSPWYSSQSCWG